MQINVQSKDDSDDDDSDGDDSDDDDSDDSVDKIEYLMSLSCNGGDSAWTLEAE